MTTQPDKTKYERMHKTRGHSKEHWDPVRVRHQPMGRCWAMEKNKKTREVNVAWTRQFQGDWRLTANVAVAFANVWRAITKNSKTVQPRKNQQTRTIKTAENKQSVCTVEKSRKNSDLHTFTICNAYRGKFCSWRKNQIFDHSTSTRTQTHKRTIIVSSGENEDGEANK